MPDPTNDKRSGGTGGDAKPDRRTPPPPPGRRTMPPPPPPGDPFDPYKSWLPTQPFANSDTAKQVLLSYETNRKGVTTPDDVKKEMSRLGDTFNSMFQNYVGRAPNPDEYEKFFSGVVTQHAPWNTPVDWTSTRQDTQNLLSDYFTRTAQDELQTKSEREAQAAVAPGSAFDTWQQNYMKSINDTEKSLTDYQTRLFEKIRPQLLTSLQAQGLLNTGGLNEAFAGVAGDLTSNVQNYMAQTRSQADRDIAGQKLAIQNVPSALRQQYEFGAIPNLTSAGQNALQNAWQQNMMNQQFGNQQSLLQQQYGYQPSLLSQYGGLILGGIAGGFGGGLAGAAGTAAGNMIFRK